MDWIGLDWIGITGWEIPLQLSRVKGEKWCEYVLWWCGSVVLFVVL
jgi:hypothetical protein